MLHTIFKTYSKNNNHGELSDSRLFFCLHSLIVYAVVLLL